MSAFDDIAKAKNRLDFSPLSWRDAWAGPEEPKRDRHGLTTIALLNLSIQASPPKGEIARHQSGLPAAPISWRCDPASRDELIVTQMALGSIAVPISSLRK
jgi:hypothetical protein